MLNEETMEVRRDLLEEVKKDYKEISKKIRTINQMKGEEKNGEMPQKYHLSHEARRLHIFNSLLRNRKYEEIEPTVKEGNEFNFAALNWLIVNQYSEVADNLSFDVEERKLKWWNKLDD